MVTTRSARGDCRSSNGSVVAAPTKRGTNDVDLICRDELVDEGRRSKRRRFPAVAMARANDDLYEYVDDPDANEDDYTDDDDIPVVLIRKSGVRGKSHALRTVHPNEHHHHTNRNTKRTVGGNTIRRLAKTKICQPAIRDRSFLLSSEEDIEEGEDCQCFHAAETEDASDPDVACFEPPQRYADVPAGITNIDKAVVDDPLYVVDYVDDMYNHHRQKELQEATDGITYLCRRRPTYRQIQPQVTDRMRMILVDWLIEVHYKFKLFEETLYLTVNVVDRYLQKGPRISTRDLQLVGVTSLLIASKYEEQFVPELRDLTYICDDAYTSGQILDMEERILQTLQYKLSVPTARTFLARFSKAAAQDDDSVDEEELANQKRLINLSARVLDGTLLSFPLLQKPLDGGYLPSQLAAASILIARNSLLTTSALDCETGCDGFHCDCDWTPTLQYYTQYSKKELMPIARAILDAKVAQQRTFPDLIAVHKKYRHSKYGSVSHVSLQEESMYSTTYLQHAKARPRPTITPETP